VSSWLLTGGTGSFGKAFTRHLLDAGATRVAILSRDELKQAEMAAEFSDPRLRFFIGSVCDEKRVELAMRGVENVVHAAAMKRVETCEMNPHEAIQTNVYGTGTVALAALRAGIRKAVILSTDKAVSPNTHYGVTKLAAERLWCRMNVYAAGTTTRFSATRYGNVWSSRGSVVPLFRKQAAAGGPLTVTDARMTRFFMSMGQAVDLVALAFREMRGGEVFLPAIMGTGIVDIAKAVAPGVPYIETGIRPGEKMHEALVSEDEVRSTYDYGDHYRVEIARTWEDVLHTDVKAKLVTADFTYRSDDRPMDAATLSSLVEAA
jgi:UDP-N-acetylglucosamine 4,6-dehydratase